MAGRIALPCDGVLFGFPGKYMDWMVKRAKRVKLIFFVKKKDYNITN